MYKNQKKNWTSKLILNTEIRNTYTLYISLRFITNFNNNVMFKLVTCRVRILDKNKHTQTNKDIVPFNVT